MEIPIQQIISFILNSGFPQEKMFDGEDNLSLRSKKFKLSELGNTGIFNQAFNFFPSDKKGSCHELAVFVCVKKETIGQNSATTNHVSFKNVLKKMVQQVLGSCYKKNKHVYFFTDQIDTNAIAEWKDNFKVMMKVCETVNVIYFTKKGDYHNVNNLFGI